MHETDEKAEQYLATSTPEQKMEAKKTSS